MASSMEIFSVLIVEDDEAELNRLERTIRRLEPGCRISRASDPVSACNQFRKQRPEVVVLDLGLSGHGADTGLSVITKMQSIDPTSRIIVLTGYTSEEIGIRAIENGAASFLTKPVNATVLHALVRDYAQTARFRRNKLEPERYPPVAGFIGDSAPMRNVYRLIHQCAATNSNVLIVGETGTGKELVAHAIHDLSSRRLSPLSVYFGSVPGTMADSELFGYVRGAFTGADTRGSEGAIRKADKGTLFIDELCSLDLEIQRKLLRAIEEKSFKPLGADSYQHSDFRLVCAAQPRIYDFVRTGQFREDLLSRVEVVTIKLPPLRERREDIVPLAEAFQTKVREGMLSGGLPCAVNGFTKEALGVFREYPWPRNIRELKHAVHNGTIQAQLRGSERIDLRDVMPRLEQGFEFNPTESSSSDGLQSAELLRPGVTLREAVERVERALITRSLKRNDNTIATVCLELGLGRTTLWRKLREYGLEN